MNEIHEECGVFGIVCGSTQEVAEPVYYGLYALQHRGQESCGIAVCDDGYLHCYKQAGLVGEALTPAVRAGLGQGNMAVGHVRYGTTGGSDVRNAQPIMVNHKNGRMALVHNGNLANAGLLRAKLEERGAIFHTASDSEIIAYLITQERLKSPCIEEAVRRAACRLRGAYSLIVMSPTKMIAVRDPHAFRPLCFGKREDGAFVVASESCALDAVGASFIRDVKAGEMLVFDGRGVRSLSVGKAAPTPCIFEYIYFARPDSVIDGISVHEARRRAGRLLAEAYPVEADVVVGVPDSGIDAALGYAEAAHIPFDTGLVKNKYIGRTFIEPAAAQRQNDVRIKLNPLKSAVAGKRVVLIDDSIVRGTTIRKIVTLLKEAGAREVHLRICSPPFLFPCYYGTDIDSRENLIACKYPQEAIAGIVGADSLGYLPLEKLHEMVPLPQGMRACRACFDGKYPTRVCENASKDKFEQKLGVLSRPQEGA